jgi:hypothetical protein
MKIGFEAPEVRRNKARSGTAQHPQVTVRSRGSHASPPARAAGPVATTPLVGLRSKTSLNKYLRVAPKAFASQETKQLIGAVTDPACDVCLQESDSRAMKLRLSDGKVIALRAIVTGGFIGAFLFALVLSAAPQLHERIHQPGGATHECAVTLLTAGTCQHTPCDAIAIAPQPPPAPSALVRHHSKLVSARLEFSLLEHAPPAIS